MSRTIYPEDIRAIASLGMTKEALRLINMASKSPGLMEERFHLALRAESSLSDAMATVGDIGRMPDMDWNDPAALRALADQIEAEEMAEAEATRRTLHHLRTRNNLMGDEGPCELAHA